MAGFLDAGAPNLTAEYGRYIDGDILGKMLFKSFLVNIIGLNESQVYVPVGRYGDVKGRSSLRADAQVDVDKERLDVELKCARVNIANRTRGDTQPNWAFGKLLATPQGINRQSYDFAFAVGVLALGLEDPGYWDYLAQNARLHLEAGRDFKLDAAPHEAPYLMRCGFFLIPYGDIRTNFFRVTVSSIPTNQNRTFFAWGYEQDECRNIWSNCIRKCLARRKSLPQNSETALPPIDDAPSY